MSTYICKKIKTFLEIDETFVPLLNNTAHSLDYSFYSSEDWVKEACGVRWLRSGEETRDYDEFMTDCLDSAVSSTVPNGEWLENMKAWIAGFLADHDTTDMALEATEKALEAASESLTHWIPTESTTPPAPSTTDEPDPSPKGGDGGYTTPLLVFFGVASWVLPLAYYATTKYRGES